MKPGILVTNLGSPDGADTASVRRYLVEFLTDPHVIDLPAPVRWSLVRLLIAPTRAPRSSKAYQKIWTPEGSPLFVLSDRLTVALSELTGLPAVLGMRYGNPTLHAAIQKLGNTQELFVIPLYPHYARSTRQTLYDALLTLEIDKPVRVLRPFFGSDSYAHLVAKGIRQSLLQPVEHLLFSFHGLPERAIRTADPTGAHCLRKDNCCNHPSPAHAFCYRHQCFTMAKLVARQLNLDWSVAFQSRLGRLPWLTPYTKDRVRELAQQGRRNIAVVAPSFVVDNLETLEELAIAGSIQFRAHGGKTLQVIPCLNDDAELAQLFSHWIANASEWFVDLHSLRLNAND